MKGVADESVGEGFREDLLQSARDRTLAVIEELAAHVKPGFTEKQAKTLLLEIQTAHGAPKSWHPPQIRFGENTTRPFGIAGNDGVVLADDDVFFLDIGPIFEGHEGDVGRAFTLGSSEEFSRCVRDVEILWREVRDHWRTAGVSGGALYDFAEARAAELGWQLTRHEANGHRIADFPHAARSRGSIETFAGAPAANRWILEIQIRHPEKPFGAFYEDLLN